MDSLPSGRRDGQASPRVVNVHQAKTHLSRLIDEAHHGETIVLAKAGKPWARLMPLAPPPPQRITALMQLLVQRLGIRKGEWYELPLRLTHADLAQLCGHTRVTVTRQLSKWRESGLIEQDNTASRNLRIAPELVDD